MRGLLQKPTLIVYPNPSNNGKISVVLEDLNNIFDITLIDMRGKVLKQWKKLTNNTVLIERLMLGVYNLKVVNKITGDEDSKKIIVLKH